jgi:hypothetical protein
MGTAMEVVMDMEMTAARAVAYCNQLNSKSNSRQWGSRRHCPKSKSCSRHMILHPKKWRTKIFPSAHPANHTNLSVY